MRYLPRKLEPALLQYLSAFPVVGLTGPRQSGKSTLLLHLLKSKYRYVTFDDYQTVRLFQDDPEKFMAMYADRVIFDEVQKAPDIFDHIKAAVDRDRQNYGKFIITGSSQFTFMGRITESLAGRIGLLTLLPFQYGEIPKPLRGDAIFSGSYPEIVQRKFEYRREWYDAYIETYLQKDVRYLTNIGDLRDFRRFIGLLAADTAKLFNMSRYAGDLGVSVTTIKRWVSVLEASYIIFLLPPFHNNYGKRIVKSPKIYFYDTGLASFLTGITDRILYESGPMAGSLFENYVIAEIKKKLIHTDAKAGLYFYRTGHGVEVDLIVDHLTRRDLIEIKNSSTFKSRMIEPGASLQTGQDRTFLLYNGKTVPLAPNMRALHYGDYLLEGE